MEARNPQREVEDLNEVEIEPLADEGLEEAAGGQYHPVCSWQHCSHGKLEGSY